MAPFLITFIQRQIYSFYSFLFTPGCFAAKKTTPGSEEQGVEEYSKTEAAAKGARCLCDSRALGVQSSLSPL